MKIQHTLLALAVAVALPRSSLLSQEPPGGVIRDLYFFDESLNDTIRYHAYRALTPSVDSTTAHTGTRSLNMTLTEPYGGLQVFWAGITDPASWWGPDTAVFWANADSRFVMWVNCSSAGDTISVGAWGFLSFYGTLGDVTITESGTWQEINLPLPSTALGVPLKGFEIGFGGSVQTILVDEFKVTNVRMFAGNGVPVVTMDYIAASQIGYSPNMRKQFTSPVSFASFEIQRVSDDAIVHVGGGPIAQMQSPLVGGVPMWIGDFTGFSLPGRYRILAGGMTSHPFNIGSDVFDEPVRAAQRMLYFQRAFTEISMPYAEGPWVHADDSHLAPPGVVGGWHEAGNYPIPMPPVAQTIQHLLDAWDEFRPVEDNTNIPESGNGTPDILDEARWGLRWVLSMQDTSGGFWTVTCPNGGSDNYPYRFTGPTDLGPYANLVLGTPATAKAVAVLAYAAVVYREFDTTFANACLAAAQRGWAWLEVHPEITPDPECAAYPTNGDPYLMQTQKMWAAAALFYATGEPEFDAAFENNYTPVTWIPSYALTHAYGASLYLKSPGGSAARKAIIRQEFANMSASAISDGNAHPFGAAIYYYWGSLGNALQRSVFGWRRFFEDQNSTQDLDQALENIHYVFGRNFLNKCYVSGLSGATNGLSEGFHHWLKKLNATPRNFPGMMSAGPNDSPSPFDASNPPFVYGYFGDPRYPRTASTVIEARTTDNDSWSTNEIAINWNAVLIYNLYAARAYARNEYPLPVQLVGLTGTLDNLTGHVRLAWTTLSETNNFGFFVERGLSPETLQLLPESFVPGHGTTVVPQHYTFVDPAPPSGLIFYRLRQVDLDGSVHFSDVISVQTATTSAVNGSTSPPSYALQVYPNPFNPATTIHYALPEQSRVRLGIYNLLGQEIVTLINEVQPAGYHEVRWEGRNMAGQGVASGVYFLRFEASGASNAFSGLKRVILMK